MDLAVACEPIGSHKYAQVIIRMCSDNCGVPWVNKWELSQNQNRSSIKSGNRTSDFCSLLLHASAPRGDGFD